MNKDIILIGEKLRRMSQQEKQSMRADIERMIEEFKTKQQAKADSNEPVMLTAQEVGDIFRTRVMDMALLALLSLQRDRAESDTAERYEEAVRTAVPKEKHVAVVTDKPRIYAVTSIASRDVYGGTRTPVICDSFEAACEYVESNSMDLWENSYMLVVIEANVPNHPYGIGLDPAGEEYWYRWNLEANRYEPIEKPKEYEKTVCFGIG
jgi:hypothetical protein